MLGITRIHHNYIESATCMLCNDYHLDVRIAADGGGLDSSFHIAAQAATIF